MPPSARREVQDVASRPPTGPSHSLPTILLSVAGLSPQVITETLYCLIKKADPPVPVREIRVVTMG